MKYIGLTGALVIVAVIATFVRYESLQPCDWLVHDTGRELGLPRIMAEARVHGSFLLRGIVEPTATDCLQDWWELKAEGKVPEEGS